MNLKQILKGIETKRGTWTSLKAGVEFSFLTGENKSASCKGTLAYQRLDERLLIQCYEPADRLVFALRTDDSHFELYMPGHKTIYKGNIFTLEASPEIESHLRAWDLYRALKPGAVPDEAELKQEKGKYSIIVYRRGDNTLIARDLSVTKDYKVDEESYYDFEGNPSVEIKRTEFKPVAKSSASFARKISITAHKATYEGQTTRETLLEIKSADFDSALTEADFSLNLPEGTHILELEDPIGG